MVDDVMIGSDVKSIRTLREEGRMGIVPGTANMPYMNGRIRPLDHNLDNPKPRDATLDHVDRTRSTTMNTQQRNIRCREPYIFQENHC